MDNVFQESTHFLADVNFTISLGLECILKKIDCIKLKEIKKIKNNYLLLLDAPISCSRNHRALLLV